VRIISFPFNLNFVNDCGRFNLDFSSDDVDVVCHFDLVFINDNIGMLLEDCGLNDNLLFIIFDLDFVVNFVLYNKLVNNNFEFDS